MKYHYTFFIDDMAVDEFSGQINCLAIDYFLEKRGWKIMLSPQQIETACTDMIRIEETVEA